MRILNRIGIIAIPITFCLAGNGMLLLLRVETARLPFIEQITFYETEWFVSHIILLLSTMCILPAALSLQSVINHSRPKILGTIMVIIIAPTSILLAGQYAIDFVVPLMVRVGGDALKVHGLLSTTSLIDILFYGLPNLVFLALMLLTIAVVWSKVLARLPAILLIFNWLMVMLGNLVHPGFQRVAILFLALSYMPLVKKMWRYNGNVV